MPTIRERLDADLKDAMRAKDELKTNTVRAVKSAIKYKEVEPGASKLEEAQIIGVITTLIKQRRESADQFKTGGRPELAVLQSYLPQQLSAEQLSAEVAKGIAEAGAKGPKDMGAVMKVLGRLKGQAEGKVISDEVKAQLAKLGG
jgi:uncharacterized protein